MYTCMYLLIFANTGLFKISILWLIIWYWLYFKRKEPTHKSVFDGTCYLYDFNWTCCLFSFIAILLLLLEERGFTEAIFYCFTVWSLCSVLIASYISTKHMHLDAMKKWYKLSKSLAIWFPCLQSIIMESLDIQKWEIKRLIKKDFSRGTLSHMSEFFPSFFPTSLQRYTYRVLQTIQMKLKLLYVWAEPAVLGRN